MTTRGEVFRRPAGNRKYEISTAAEQPRNAWTVNRQEHDQWVRLIGGFKREYPDANVFQTLLAERAFKAHILLQRIEDRRCFLDGSETGAHKVDKYFLELEASEDQKKWKEYREWFPFLMRELRECCKLLLANGIHLNIDGDIGAIFKLDEETKEKVKQYKSEGNQTDNPETE